MAMVCPQCNGAFEQRLQCPHCDIRLVYQEGRAASPRAALLSGSWQQKPWGRILIGLVLAQGLYHGLRHLCSATLLGVGMSADELWNSLRGLLLDQGLQVAALCVGGSLAGAGQRAGVVYGAVVGVWNGVLLLAIHPEQASRSQGVVLYGLPVLQAAVGALAGFMGSRIWQPLTPTTNPAEAARKAPKPPSEPRPNLFEGPIAWFRVGVGTAIAVAGTLSADIIIDFLERASNAELYPGSILHAQIITWEIAALAVFAGGAVAGTSTWNGLKQGLAVGIATSVVLFGIRLAGPTPSSMEAIVLSWCAPMLLGVLGGGFGCQMMPPLATGKRRFVQP